MIYANIGGNRYPCEGPSFESDTNPDFWGNKGIQKRLTYAILWITNAYDTLDSILDELCKYNQDCVDDGYIKFCATRAKIANDPVFGCRN